MGSLFLCGAEEEVVGGSGVVVLKWYNGGIHEYSCGFAIFCSSVVKLIAELIFLLTEVIGSI